MSKVEETNDYVVPSNPADRKKIKDAISQMAAVMQEIEDKRGYIKDVQTDLKESFKIPSRISAKMAKTLHKHNYVDVAQESEQFSLFYETLFSESVSNP